MSEFVFGIDVGGTTVKCGLFTAEGEVLDKWEIPTRTEDNGSHILRDIAVTVLKKCEEKDLEKEQIKGIGIAVPGPVLKNGDVAFAVNLHWGYTEVAKELSEMTGLPVKTGNDANVAALGEMWCGGGRGTDSMVMITLGTGVGGGVIIGGKMVSGAHGAGGEIGHICIDPEDPIACNCGNHGCLEQKTSATGIVRLAKEELVKNEMPSMLDAATVTAKDVFEAYGKGDPLARVVVKRMADYLGRAMAVIAATIDPEKFVIGGGVSKAGMPLIDAVSSAYEKYCFPECKDTQIVLAELGNDAGIFGSAKMLLD